VAILRLFGWTLRFEGLPDGCGIALCYPHTSNWDFVIGMLALWGAGIHGGFLGKDTLFRVPVLGWFMRRWAGLPVDRSAASGMTDSIIARFRDEQARGRRVWFVIAPEGTRKLCPHLKSGFYHIAMKAGVAVGLAFVDYRKREVGMTCYLWMTGNVEADLARIAEFYEGKDMARFPDQVSPIRFK